MKKWLLPVIVLTACDRPTPEAGEVPPPPAVRSVCDERPDGPLDVPVGLPSRAEGWCIDPTTDVRSYGAGTPAPLDQVCTELFNGECELYKTYGLEVVRTLSFAPVTGGDARVSVVVSEFRGLTGAFGFFSHRVLAGGLPEKATVEPLEVSGHGALGTGVAYVQRGRRVVEFTYVSETETPSEVEKRSRKLLAPLARAVASELGGETTLPPAARLIALEGHEPMGIEVVADGLMGVVGSGRFARAHFGTAEPPHRLVATLHDENKGAADLLRLLRKAGEAKKLKGRKIYRVRVTRADRTPETWHLMQSGRRVFGVGPAAQRQDEDGSTDDQWAAFCIRRLHEVARQK